MRAKRGAIGLLAAGALAAVAMTGAQSAGAAMQVGQTFNPDLACNPDITFLVTTSPGNAYVVPSNGVITSWKFQASSAPPSAMRLKIGRSNGGNNFTIVGQSALETPAAGRVNTFTTRIPVRAGDILGYYFGPPVAGQCASSTPGYGDHYLAGVDVPPGTSANYASESGYRPDISALLEPDADDDGFGDETQDCAPADPSRAEDCSAPTAAITGGPKDKTKKKTATFDFTGADARTLASFECRLDEGVFASCASPFTVKVKKGRHTFEVRAVDAAGNVGVPASDSWKVKRPKKKK